jgi:predicted RNA-binding protein with PIN domain
MPLRIIIDGYNLMGIYHRDLEKERNRLIEKLKRYSNKKGHQIILVFDGYKSDRLKRDIISSAGIKVIYTKAGETTDEFISSFLRNTSAQWVVVSSDHLIQKEAWSNNSIPISSEEFEGALERALGSEEKEENQDLPEVNHLLIEKLSIDNLQNEIRKKGNPRQPSKKEKSIARILEKL